MIGGFSWWSVVELLLKEAARGLAAGAADALASTGAPPACPDLQCPPALEVERCLVTVEAAVELRLSVAVGFGLSGVGLLAIGFVAGRCSSRSSTRRARPARDDRRLL